jgi:uncharacterized protein (TIGR00266 family)
MNVEVRHSPSFAVARVTLGANEGVRTESGAMMATSAGVAADAKMEGGLLKSLKRATMGGESLFITTYTAPATGGWVDVAANLPGDIHIDTVRPDRPLNISRGSWLCSAATVELDTKWGGFKNLAGGEGGFLVRAAGDGPVVLACYGALDTHHLGPGESLVVDTGHMVAYEEGVTVNLRQLSGGMIRSAKTGEYLVFEFTGPGTVQTQTRNPSALISWLTTALPFQRG